MYEKINKNNQKLPIEVKYIIYENSVLAQEVNSST